MGRNISTEKLLEHKKSALCRLESYIDSLIKSPDAKIRGKADKFSYWLEDWTTFLDFEPEFSSASLRRYKRGEIIKAHLGYNVGSEEGGLHYCVVIDKNNSRNSPVLTIVPLTSVKKKTDLLHLHRGNVHLGNELFTNLSSKISYTEKTFLARMVELKETIGLLNEETPDDTLANIKRDLDVCKQELVLLNRMKDEVAKMKIGSIALVGQIRTISKIRIYDPKTNFDILSNVKLSTEKLDLIDSEILHNFTGQK